MKKIILGILIGLAILAAMLYFGGGRHVRKIGKKTVEAGERMEKYEGEIKKKAARLQEALRKTAEGTKETVKKTAKGARETVERLKKVREAIE